MNVTIQRYNQTVSSTKSSRIANQTRNFQVFVMANFIVVTILFTVFGIVIYSVDSSIENETYSSHYQRVESFKCLQPQPRAISVKDHFVTDQGKVFIPRTTVLHVCDNESGSCLGSDREHCISLDSEEVTLTFKVTYLVDTDTRRAGSTQDETITFTNHTLCGCAIPMCEILP